MKRFPAAILLVLAAGCGEVPPIAIGDGGIRLMNGSPESAAAAYDMAYAQMTPQHIRLRRSMDPQSYNIVGARTAVERILRSLETMRALVIAPQQPKFDPYIELYGEGLRDLRGNRRSPSFMSRVARAEREIKSRLAPGDVTLAGPAPAEPPVTKTPDAPAPAAPAPVVPPPSGNLAEAPSAEPPATPKPADAPDPPKPAAPAAAVPYRLVFKAWEKAHEDLVEAQSGGKKCDRAYADLTGTLDLLGRGVDGRRAEQLRTYRECYAEIHERTAGFTTLPGKTTAEDISGELNLVARWIRKALEPADDDR